MAGCALVRFAPRSGAVKMSTMVLVMHLILAALASLVLFATGQDFGTVTPAPKRFSIAITPPSPVLNGTLATIACSTIVESERADIALVLTRSATPLLATPVTADSRIAIDPPHGTTSLNRTWTFNPMTVSDSGTYRCRYITTDSTLNVQVVQVDASLVTIQSCSVYQVENGTYSLTPDHLPLLPGITSFRQNDSDVVSSDATSVLVCELTTRGAIDLSATDSYWFRDTRRPSQPSNVTSGQSDARVRTEFRQVTTNGNILLWLAILTIENPSTDDAGNHTLALLSPDGAPLNMTTCNAASDTCNYPVVLYTPPVIVEGLVNFESPKGSADTGECVVSGVPVPTVTWFMHNMAIDPLNNKRFLVNRLARWNGMAFDVRSVLTISKAEYSDRGYIRCQADSTKRDGSAVGTVSSEALFRVRDPLGPLWPLLGIFALTMIYMIIIYVDGNLRKKSKSTGTDEVDGDENGEDEADGGEGSSCEHLSLLFRCPHPSKDGATARYRHFSESEL